METVMSNKARNTSGKFATKSETPRKIRSVNLTDDAWQWLADVAAQAGVSRNDFIEAMAGRSTPLMETVKAKTSPLIETVELDNAKIAEHPDNNILPFIETVNLELESLKQQLEEVKADRDKVFENSLTLKTKLERQVGELRSKLEREEADREELQKQFDELNKQYLDKVFVVEAVRDKKSATAGELPEAADLLNQLKTRRKKSNASLADVELILEMIEES